MALFPDGMVCGFRPADRSRGGRDETQFQISVASQTTHTVSDDYVASLGSHKCIRSHSYFTHSHTRTHLRKRRYCGILWLFFVALALQNTTCG